jgi:hypothetical protein
VTCDIVVGFFDEPCCSPTPSFSDAFWPSNDLLLFGLLLTLGRKKYFCGDGYWGEVGHEIVGGVWGWLFGCWMGWGGGKDEVGCPCSGVQTQFR